MKIEMINENKIKVMFDAIELVENNISIHSFLSNSFETQKLFLAILDIANEEFGFNTNNCKLSCETISFNNKNFVVIVTKSASKVGSYSKYNLLDINNLTNSYNNNSFITNKLIYKFSNMEDVLLFCKYFIKIFPKVELSSSLYQYQNKFFLKIDIKTQNLKKVHNIISVLSEFESNLSISKLAFQRLEEYSDLIFKDNAIENLVQN